jgi:hypothetical protein
MYCLFYLQKIDLIKCFPKVKLLSVVFFLSVKIDLNIFLKNQTLM